MGKPIRKHAALGYTGIREGNKSIREGGS